MSQDGSGGPNPFSREGSSPDDALGRHPAAADPASPATPAATPEWPSYPDRDARPETPYPAPNHPTPNHPTPTPAEPAPYAPSPPDPAPYGPADVQPYPTTGYPDPTNPYAPSPYAPTPYVPSPYAPSPYAAGYGLGSPYGVAPQHPQAVTALVLGIVGLVVCPPVGIAGLFMGVRVRRDSDTNPGQFTGRGLGTAALVLGIISIVVMVFWIVVFGGLVASDY